MVGISLESDTFYFTENACFKILNTWTVVDWCQRPANAMDNDSTGLWTYVQEIKITETDSPVIASCQDLQVDIFDSNCSVAEILLTNSATDSSCGFIQTVDWTYQIDTNGDGAFDIIGDALTDVVSVSLSDIESGDVSVVWACLLYTSPSPRDRQKSRMPSSA